MNSMKDIIIFWMIATLAIYIPLNLYVFLKGNLALSLTGLWFRVYLVVFVLLALVFPASRILRVVAPGEPAMITSWIGSFWLAVVFYLFLLGLVVDLFRFANFIVPFIPAFIENNRIVIGRIAAAFVFASLTVTFVWGYINAKNVRVRSIPLAIVSLGEVKNPLTVAYISDVHIGYEVGERHLADIVEKVNGADPDLILIGGDLLEEPPVLIEDMLDTLSLLNAPYGVYATAGNHEFYTGLSAGRDFMNRAGIRLLIDEVKTIEGLLNVAGLVDPSGNRAGLGSRDAFRRMMEERDETLPTVLLYHSPVRIEEIAASGAVDLMLSGHTHNGQFFPVNMITNRMFRVAYGRAEVDGMHLYVSSGAGTWGPPIRVGSESEVVIFTLTAR
ncbi:MAG: metallophosphoesterase [Deltaproteobacteria bacterium]|nr:metallophosphoesterase [Candidatus Zymogenaceae bacterium]